MYLLNLWDKDDKTWGTTVVLHTTAQISPITLKRGSQQ